MLSTTTYLISLTLTTLLPSLIFANSEISGIVADGNWYQGWDWGMHYDDPIPLSPGWQANNPSMGYVNTEHLQSPDIICHKNATPANTYVSAKPGSNVTFQWTRFAEYLQGPVLVYIAKCPDDCLTVDKSKLLWIKLSEKGWISGSGPGTWATDTLKANNNSWAITLPSDIAPGNYIIRHELIILSYAQQPSHNDDGYGAQFYPYCVNFRIGGSGTKQLAGGVLATSFYNSSDPGILFDMWRNFTNYTIPGPPVSNLFSKGEQRRHVRNWRYAKNWRQEK